jgi:hypothetical protein
MPNLNLQTWACDCGVSFEDPADFDTDTGRRRLVEHATFCNLAKQRVETEGMWRIY